MAISSKQIQEVGTTKGVLHFYKDWEECDGGIVMQDAQTIKRYRQIREEHPDADECGVFFAFSDKQFEEGRQHLIDLGKMKEGDKLTYVENINGLFGTRDGVKQFLDFYNNRAGDVTKECDPQEVYFYEYNNHECMMAYNGDRDAIEIVIDNWGADVAKGIKRFNDYLTVEQVANGVWL